MHQLYVNNLFAKYFAVSKVPLSFDDDPRDVIHARYRGVDKLYGVSLGWRF